MRALLPLILVALLAACGTDPAAEDPEDPGDALDATEPAEDGEEEADEAEDPGDPGSEAVTGTLDGDPQLEGGCVWLDTDAERHEIIWPEGYEAEADPVRLLRDGEVVAEAGDQVTVDGREAPDMASVCQVGPIFEADHVEVATP